MSWTFWLLWFLCCSVAYVAGYSTGAALQRERDDADFEDRLERIRAELDQIAEEEE